MEPKKPQIPSLKDTKRPELKIKGLAVGTSLMDRLKTFRKKDLAFIAAGLAVLFLAPLVEHFLMTPESGQTSAFKEGWSFRDSGGAFGKGGSPYEPGVTGLAPGGMLGAGSEIITPLNVRDPSALVMGPGQSAQQPVTAPPPTNAAPAKPASDWKDALAAAAGRGAQAATKSASLPVPKAPLQGGLRGLGVLGGGGSGASYGLPAISAGNVPGKVAQSNALTSVKSATGYQGVAGKRGNAPSGSIEDLKKAASSAAGEFNKGGGGASNLLTAAEASQAIPGGSSSAGGGGIGQGNEDKGGGGAKDNNSKSQGENLDFIIAKEKALADVALENEIKKKKAMFPLEMEQEVKKTFLMKGAVEPIAGALGDAIKSGFGSLFDRDKAAAARWYCKGPNGTIGFIPSSVKVVSGMDKCPGDDKSFAAYVTNAGGKKNLLNCKGGAIYGEDCDADKATEAPKDPKVDNPLDPLTNGPGDQMTSGTGGVGLQALCASIAANAHATSTSSVMAINKAYESLLEPARQLISAEAYTEQFSYRTRSKDTDCTGAEIGTAGKYKKDVKGIQADAIAEFRKAITGLNSEITAINDAMQLIDPKAENKGAMLSCKAMENEFAKGEKAGCTDAMESKDCATLRKTIKDELAKPKNDNYFGKAETEGESGLATYLTESDKRADEVKASIDKAAGDKQDGQGGFMKDAVDLREEINKVMGVAKGSIEKWSGQSAPEYREVAATAGKLEVFRQQIDYKLNTTRKTVDDRLMNEVLTPLKAVAARYGTAAGPTGAARDRSAVGSGFVQWAVKGNKGQPAVAQPASGYSDQLNGTCAKDACLPLFEVKPKTGKDAATKLDTAKLAATKEENAEKVPLFQAQFTAAKTEFTTNIVPKLEKIKAYPPVAAGVDNPKITGAGSTMNSVEGF